MDHPKWIKVGPHDLRIVPTEALGEDHGLNGQYNGASLKIKVDPSCVRKREVLLHEVLHGCWDNSPLRNADNHDHEEDVISALSPAILQVLRDNPDFVSWLLESDHG